MGSVGVPPITSRKRSHHKIARFVYSPAHLFLSENVEHTQIDLMPGWMDDPILLGQIRCKSIRNQNTSMVILQQRKITTSQGKVTTNVDAALRDIHQTTMLAPPSPASSDLLACLAQRNPHALQSVLGPRGPCIKPVGKLREHLKQTRTFLHSGESVLPHVTQTRWEVGRVCFLV